MVTLSFTIFSGQKNYNRAHMLFQVLCGFEPIFYTTHPNEEPFVFVDNKIISENLLWWPCPIQIDGNMVEEFGLLETIEMILEDKEVEKYIRMRSPIRMDFDVENNTEEHPGAHLHMEHEECRINTDEPICFNRFINYIIKSFYPGWKVEFKEYDYINFKYDKPKHKITYNNRTKIMIE